MSARSSGRLADGVVAAALFAATAIYVFALPRSLGGSDEALYLYEAKALLAGKRLYVDVFDIVPPGSLYLMELVFRTFGASLAAARGMLAVVIGLLGAVVYATARTLGVRVLLAVA